MVVEHLFRRDSHSQKTHILKVSIPRCVSRRLIAPVMRFAIDLHR
jgi:hypothetical protein